MYKINLFYLKIFAKEYIFYCIEVEMTNSEKFITSSKIILNLKESPSNDEKLSLYKYFKQTTSGDVNTPKPGLFDIAGSAKWKAWSSVKGTSMEDAEKLYIDTVDALIKKYGIKN
jgi:diazepam-binding inhibitor (GABA receptor modulating acyl-CoA-binding protein)